MPLSAEQVPHLDEDTKKLVEKFEHGFFAKNRLSRECRTFVVPGKGYWDDSNDIETIRKSTYEDFITATPGPMPRYMKPNPYSLWGSKRHCNDQVKGYHLCKKVAVSSDGKIYRATDEEIVAALKKIKDAPSTDAATYVKAVQEVRRRHAIATKAQKTTSDETASSPKRRRVHFSP